MTGPQGFGTEERERVQTLLGHEFRDAELLERAFTHPSWSYENDGTRGNERLEFLGDAVVDLVVAELLYVAHPDWAEGELTRARRALVNNRTLAAHSRELGLGQWVRLGRGERSSGGAGRDRLLGNLFEAVVGAVYLDGGLHVATRFLRSTFGDAVEAQGELPVADPKTRLQEWSVASQGVFPDYETVGDTGVENDGLRFRVEVRIGSEVFGAGEGRTKRDAEQSAADAGLERVGGGV
ncbi:MAG: ribonuclease III [Deltaproteobacteria bacterium]|nr:ribonuclease III [Deltaproteobacteria bacterium]MBW2447773.1 ribonuclease III [Deltaproteobacteria bacterium]